ncbi:MAG: flippase [Candidatus Magasanikbacteria bacterium]|nr:flippase [Candidatus Magasanikbacteria bacterium]
MAYSVAKNTSFLTTASIVQKIISFVYFTVIARLIGVESTGAYFFALTFTSIFAVMADFGFSAVLTREIAKKPEDTQRIFSTALGGKFIIGAAAYILVVIASYALGYPVQTRHLICLAGATMWFDNLHSLFYAVFRAKRNLKYEAFGIVASQFITMLIGSIALYLRWPLIWLIGAYTIPSILNVLYSGFFAVRVCALKLSIIFTGQAWKEFLLMAWPFAVAGIIGRLYSYSDSLIMSKLLTGRELGWWSVPYKITFAFQFIPLALSASIYPVFSALFLSDKNALARLFEKSWRYLFTIVFPLAAGIFAISASFIVSVYGQAYSPSIMPLRILVIALVFGYLALISGALLNAVGEQRKQTMLMAVVLVINIIANVILIPRYGINGAAISALIGNFALWIIGYILVSRIVEINGSILLKYCIKAFVPAIIMGAVIFWSAERMNVIFAIPTGAVLYLGLLFITGGISKEIIKEIRTKLTGNSNYENIDNNA